MSNFSQGTSSSTYNAPYKQYGQNYLTSLVNQFSPTGTNSNFRDQFQNRGHIPMSPQGSSTTPQQESIQKVIDML